MIRIRKISAGALYYAVFISFIISVISGLLISSTYLYNAYIDRQIIQDQLKSNVKSGINLILKNPNLVKYGSPEEITLFDNDYDKATITRQHWGVYDILLAKSERNKLKYSDIALVGTNLRKTENVALYLSDQKKYLSISGNTLIKGTCYLPKLGIKRAYIEGQGYQNKELVYGTIQQSKEQLPALYPDKIKYIEELVNLKISKADSIIELNKQPNETAIYNSFYNRTLIVYTGNTNQLSGLTISGNLIIKSDQELEIQASCNLSDVIIIAPSIKVHDGFTGTVQLFAKEIVSVGKDCKFMFPSFIGVIREKGENTDAIMVGENSVIAGGLILYSTSPMVKDPNIIRLSQNATVYGLVYCNGYIEHKGNIYGSLYSDGFTLRTPASLYENHLLNATIDYSKLPAGFIGTNILAQPIIEDVIKWSK